MARCCIRSGVCLPAEMRHFEIPGQCSLVEAKCQRIIYFVECTAIAKDLDQRLVISDDDEVIAALLFTKPNQDLVSVVEVCVGKSRIVPDISGVAQS